MSGLNFRPFDSAKRGADIFVSGISLVVLSPIMVSVALLIFLSLGQPVFFAQERSGLHGKPFRLFKFRTMVDQAHFAVNVDESERIPSVGRFLRRSSLDELPQLWNIFVGEMSFVGPRPLLTQYLHSYSKRHGRRHEVRPGLTGLAQVNGRNLLTWEEKFELDIIYVETRNLVLDLLILLKTIPTVVSRRGVNSDGGTTAEPFAGYARNVAD